jgi:hypothetical protein
MHWQTAKRLQLGRADAWNTILWGPSAPELDSPAPWLRASLSGQSRSPREAAGNIEPDATR